jgi:hypothetical protein
MIHKAKKALLAAALAVFTTVPVAAQLGDLDNLLRGGVQDANYLLTGYMEPFASGFGSSLNTGWIQSAQPHGFLPIPGFHLRISMQVTALPSSARTFEIDPAKLSELEVRNNVFKTPTVSGSRNGATASFNFKTDPTNTEVFSLPAGTGLAYVPSPMIQVGIGLPKKSQLMVRYVPTQDLGRFGSIGLWGVGFQHEVLQYIPIAKRIPLLNMSVVGGYTSLSMSKNLGSGRDLNWTTNAWNANLIAGLTTPFIKILSVYAGAGYESASSNLKMTGTYSTNTGNVTDPIDLKFDSGGNVRLVGGLRFKLALLTLNAEYTKSQYSTGTVGVGLSFR